LLAILVEFTIKKLQASPATIEYQVVLLFLKLFLINSPSTSIQSPINFSPNPSQTVSNQLQTSPHVTDSQKDSLSLSLSALFQFILSALNYKHKKFFFLLSSELLRNLNFFVLFNRKDSAEKSGSRPQVEVFGLTIKSRA
jgi:hypothetical protein